MAEHEDITDLDHFVLRIRRTLLQTLLDLGYGHFGGSLSIVEALAALYGRHLRFDPLQPQWSGRDFFILSKGHAGPALYATLAECGFFPRSRLASLNANGTRLPSHPDRNLVEGVDMTTGSMGQGISVAAGLAHALHNQGRSNRVFTLVGDGELDEGQCWEAIQFVAHHELPNFVLLVDDNKRQLDGPTRDICNPHDFVSKIQAFGIESCRVNGQDVHAIDDALSNAASAWTPQAIVLDTTKGAGVAHIEQLLDNHHLRLDSASSAAVSEAVALLADALASAS